MKQSDILKDQGYKLTPQRVEVLKVLKGYPLSAQDILTALQRKKVDIDLATIYRALEILVKTGIVHELLFGEGKKRYEIVDADNHHHHLICTHCGTIQDISFKKEEALLKELGKISNFKIQNHSFEVYGLCTNCQ